MSKQLAIIMSLYKNDTLEFVKLAVESILNQTYSQFDFYIQYDGFVQKDVDDYLSDIKDERIHINRRDENKGLAYSLNELLDTVMNQNYEYIARMDADDISLPERFEKQIVYMEAHPETECLGTWAIEINSDGSEYFRKQMPETHEGCWKPFMYSDFIIHHMMTSRKSYMEKVR